MNRFLATTLLLSASVLPAAPPVVPSDGTDGILNLAGNGTTTIDLGLAATGDWDTPVDPANAGKGIYDPKVWAVVYKYESVNIGTGRTVTFKNHPTGAPVVWLVQGDVLIDGTVSVSANGTTPGPGGFHGGRSGAGLGPGGAFPNTAPQFGAGGAYGPEAIAGADVPFTGKPYGNPTVFPLIGGSGGAAKFYSAIQEHLTGGGGGGAILIASPGTIAVGGSIRANGGNGTYYGSLVIGYRASGGNGSGGGIRLVADSVSGGGTLRAQGVTCDLCYYSGGGRIRLEANLNSMLDPGNPPASFGAPGEPVRLLPDETTPQIRSIRLGDRAINPDPVALAYTPQLTYDVAGDYELLIEAGMVPSDARIEIRVTPATGAVRFSEGTFVEGNLGASLWRAQVTLPDGRAQIQARAILPDTAP